MAGRPLRRARLAIEESNRINEEEGRGIVKDGVYLAPVKPTGLLKFEKQNNKKAFAERMQMLTENRRIYKHIKEILDDGPTNPLWKWAVEFSVEHGHGKARQAVDLSGEITIAPKLYLTPEDAI